jgi:hypothetical protein
LKFVNIFLQSWLLEKKISVFNSLREIGNAWRGILVNSGILEGKDWGVKGAKPLILIIKIYALTPKGHIRKKLCKGILLTNKNESGFLSHSGCPQEISRQEDHFNLERRLKLTRHAINHLVYHVGAKLNKFSIYYIGTKFANAIFITLARILLKNRRSKN